MKMMLRNNLAWNFIAIARLEVDDSSDLHVSISAVALSFDKTDPDTS